MKRTLFVVVVAVFFARSAAAQDVPRFGLVMGYPAQIALLWNVADRVAVRPELNWSRNALESTTSVMIFSSRSPEISETTTITENDSWSIGPAVSVLIYLSKSDALRTYVSPRFAYSRTIFTTDLGASLATVLPPVERETTTTNSGYAGSGSVGAQYALGKRFGVFGELGIEYARRTTSPDSDLGRTETKSSSLALRSGVGVVLFFGS